MFKFDKNKIEQIKQGRKVEMQYKDISDISIGQVKQDDDITNNFIANAEIYEMLLNQSSVNEASNISTFSVCSFNFKRQKNNRRSTSSN